MFPSAYFVLMPALAAFVFVAACKMKRRVVDVDMTIENGVKHETDPTLDADPPSYTVACA